MKDCLILGGGLAGLSLAYRLAQKGSSVTLLEKRTDYTNDRTWCFWNTHHHPFEHLVKYRWGKWRINFGKSKSCYSSSYEYQMISAIDFYQDILERLRSFPRVSIHMGMDVQDVAVSDTHVEVMTGHGCFAASKGYDSRPTPHKTSLFQHFYGWHIRVDKPLFDPSEVILMDFEVDQSRGIHFMYLLPFSPTEALIEPTYFSSRPFEREDYESSMKDYLFKRYKTTSFHVIRQENGVLPMTTQFADDPHDRVQSIGVRGGWTRSSSGYAFLAIQEAIDHLIAASESKKGWERFLDRIFLSYLEKNPSQAPMIFSTLFQKNDPDSLIRFLSGKSTMMETLRVISSLPKGPFLKEVLR